MAGEAWNNQLVSLIIITAGGGFTGLFMYSPVPGAGNLVTSIAPAAGVDPFGNPYPSGVNVGKPTGVQMNLGVDPTGIGILVPLLNDSRWFNGEITGAISPGPPPFADIAIIGPSGKVSPFRGHVALTFNSSDNVSSSANLEAIYNDDNNVDHFYTVIDCSGFNTNACAALTATQPGTGTSSTNPAISESWHDLRPLTNSFIGTVAGLVPPQYRKCADGDVQIYGNVRTPPTTGNYNSVTWGTLPAAYRPNHLVRVPICNAPIVGSPSPDPAMSINSTGALTFVFLPTSLAQTDIFVNCRFPLDNTGVIQS
jgi:hypothetical protein